MTDQLPDGFVMIFRQAWQDKYERVLATGLLGDDERVVAAKFALLLAAEEFLPRSSYYKMLFKRVKRWV